MREFVEQFIEQIEDDQILSLNTKSSYKSDLNELIDYILLTKSKISDVNHEWVKNFLKHLETTNKERNSYNRRASTFRLFLRFLYKNNFAPTNYSLIVDNVTTFVKSQEDELKNDDIKSLIEDTKLRIEHRLILSFIGRLGLTATQIASLNTFQVDFENKVINLSNTEKIHLPLEIFIILREYLIETRSTRPNSNEHLSLFLDEKGTPILESDIYKLIKKLSEELNLQGKFTTRNLKKLSEDKIDVMSMQREIFNIISSG